MLSRISGKIKKENVMLFYLSFFDIMTVVDTILLPDNILHQYIMVILYCSRAHFRLLNDFLYHYFWDH